MTSASRTRGRFDIPVLKERADLVAEVEERSGPGRRSGRTVRFRCPSPDHDDRTPSFTVDTESRQWRCWSQCGRSGDVIELVEWLDGLSTGEAIAYLGRRYGLEPDTGHDRPRPRKAPSSRPPVRVVTPATDAGQPHPDPEKGERLLGAFLDRRGWSWETADAVGLSVVLDRWGRPRVRFPFRRGEEVLVWQDRALLDGQEPKWLTPSGATLYLFGLETLNRLTEDLRTCPVCPVVGSPAVWLVEGPADAVTLRNVFPDISALGIPGTESWKDHYAAALSGLPVVVVADNDPAGERLRETVTAALYAAEAVPMNVRVPEDYNDLSEWYSAAGMEDFAARLLDLTDAAVEVALTRGSGIVTADNVRPITGKDGKARAAAMAPTTMAEAAALQPVAEWPEVVPFDAAEPPAPFPADALPPVMARFAAETAEALGTTPDLVAVSMLAAVSTVTGGRWSVEASWRRGWREQLVLFIVGVAPPGSMKSAAMGAATGPIADLQQELRERFAVEVADAKALRAVDEKRLAHLQKQAAKADADDARTCREEAADLARRLAEQPEPAIPQLFTTDATPESVEVALYRNGERFAWLDSEGGPFTTWSGRHASRPGAVSIDIFLKGYTGEAVEVARLGREGASLRSPALTIGMTTQPDHLRSAMANVEGGVGRGLFDRFLFSWPESSPVDRSQAAEPVPSEVAAAYDAALRRLYQVAETVPPGDRRVLPMNPDAADILQSFAQWVTEAGEPGGDLDADGLKGWAEKLPGQVHRLAGMLTLVADPYADAVTAEAAAGAVKLGHYFTAHTRRTMSELGLDTGVKAARKCWEAIVHARTRSPRMWSEWPEVVTLQDVAETVRGNRSLGLDQRAAVEAALTLLAEEYHLLRRTEDGKGGRKRWEVHPDHRPRL